MVYYVNMKSIPYKVRLWLSIGLFIWSIVAFIVSIIWYTNTKQLWIIIAIPIIAFICFMMSIVFFPRFKDDGTPTVESKQKKQKQLQYSEPKISKKPFITEKEWEELDEEDEECMYIEEDD